MTLVSPAHWVEGTGPGLLLILRPGYLFVNANELGAIGAMEPQDR